MIPDLALSIQLQLGTASGSLVRHRSRIVAVSTTSSETPLPEHIYPAELGQSSTNGLMTSRSISAELLVDDHVRDLARGTLRITNALSGFGVDPQADQIAEAFMRRTTPVVVHKRILARK